MDFQKDRAITVLVLKDSAWGITLIYFQLIIESWEIKMKPKTPFPILLLPRLNFTHNYPKFSPSPGITGRIGGCGQFLTLCPHHSFLLTLFPCSTWCPSHRADICSEHGPSCAAEGQLNTSLFSGICRGIPAPLSGLSSPHLSPLTLESTWLFL